MAYCTPEEVKAYLNDEMGAGDDTLLAALITRATAMIEGETARTFEASADTTRYFTVNEDTRGRVLYLDADLCAITSVTNNADSVSGGEGLTNGTHYITQPRNATPYYALRLLNSSNKGWDYTNDPETGIQVTGRWAYSTTPPADVKHACIELAAYLYRRRDSVGDDTDRPLATGDGVVILDARVSKIVRDVIARYRRTV